MKIFTSVVATGLLFSSCFALATEYKETVFEAGHSSLQKWLLSEQVPFPEGNEVTPERVELGKALFFDPRLSGDKNMSCATCHNPVFGWSDGLATARGNKSKVLGRASPTVINTAYNDIQMWDGRKKTLEDQAIGPMLSHDEMNMDIPALLAFLKGNDEYAAMFDAAYPGQEISEDTLTKAIASFERTVVSNDSPFDKWVRGDKSAMTASQVNGFKVFVDPKRGNCSVCHSGPNFTDNGFHNLGLASFGNENPDVGRYSERPLGLMKGAFKTPTIRDITLTAPYFHDGSANSLKDVVAHYQTGGVVKTNISPNFTMAHLSEQEVNDLVSFMHALTTKHDPFVLPNIPLEN